MNLMLILLLLADGTVWHMLNAAYQFCMEVQLVIIAFCVLFVLLCCVGKYLLFSCIAHFIFFNKIFKLILYSLNHTIVSLPTHNFLFYFHLSFLSTEEHYKTIKFCRGMYKNYKREELHYIKDISSKNFYVRCVFCIKMSLNVPFCFVVPYIFNNNIQYILQYTIYY